MALHESGVIALSTVLGALFMLMVVLIYRRCRDEAHTYTRVAHGLDDEERQFKKVLEMQLMHAQGEDIDELFSVDEEELDFSAKDKDTLAKLENLRSSLVAADGIRPQQQEQKEGLDEEAEEDDPDMAAV